MRKRLVLLCLILITIGGLILHRYEIQAASEEVVTLLSGRWHLSGSLYLPKTSPPYPVVIFLHGDGAQDRTLSGGYNIIINTLLRQGVACFSYDKAGVGLSEGDWLTQNMKDRSEEVQSILKWLKTRSDVNQIGVMGFSQGGWVISELALAEAPVDFYIVVGGAIDWETQHIYYEKKRLEKQNWTREEQDVYLEYVKKADVYIEQNDYNGYVQWVTSYPYETPMSESRFLFAHLNIHANALEGIYKIKVPFLGLFGEADENVDINESYATYLKGFEHTGHQNFRLVKIPKATHELLKEKYNHDRTFLAFDALIKQNIYAEGALEELIGFIDYVTNGPK